MFHSEFELDLFLIRHGESANNVAHDRQVPWNLDPPLTQRGADQIRALARRFKAEGTRFDRLYSSSLQRAIDSAKILIADMGSSQEIESVAALDEIRVALADGMPFDQWIDARERARRAQAGKWWVYGTQAGDRVESERALERRVMGWIEDTLLFNPDVSASPGTVRVGLVSHGHAIRAVLQSVLGFEERYIRRLQIDNAAISRLRFNADGWFPVSINDAWHTHAIGEVQREQPHHPMREEA